MPDALKVPEVALSEKHIQFNHRRMVSTQPARLADWKRRHELLEGDQSYHMPRIHELYARVLIHEAQRDALHVTRKSLEALIKHSFLGSQGWVAQLSSVIASMRATITDAEQLVPSTPGEKSLADCLVIMRSSSYNISEGPNFVRLPAAIPRLEQKYYVEDLQRY